MTPAPYSSPAKQWLHSLRSGAKWAALAFCLTAVSGRAENASSAVNDYFSNWFKRVAETQAEQPHWVTPVATVTPRLEQEYRYDQFWQAIPAGKKLTSFGGGKGLELIPAEPVEIILGIPAWQSRNTPLGTDGWADESFLIKYRLLSSNEENGNYILTLFMGFSVPTGSAHNTTDHAAYTPTIAFGKGWGDFDFQSTLGFSMPDNGAAPGGSGTPLAWNTALQYRVAKVLWPEVEFNYTYWPNGTRKGENQLFVTPGLVLGKFPIWERLGFTIGVGCQVAVTDKPLYDCNFIITAQLPF